MAGDTSKWGEREWSIHFARTINTMQSRENPDAEPGWGGLTFEEKDAVLDYFSEKIGSEKLPGSMTDAIEYAFPDEKAHLPYKMEVRQEPLELEGRTAFKAFPDDPEQAIKTLKGMNPDVKDLRIRPDGSVVGRREGEDFERVLDPGFWASITSPKEMWEDTLDVSAELGDMLVSYLGGKAGQAAGTLVGGPIGAAAGEGVGSGLAGYQYEKARQGLGNYLGMSNKDIDYEKAREAGYLSAAPGVGLGLLKGLKKVGGEVLVGMKPYLPDFLTGMGSVAGNEVVQRVTQNPVLGGGGAVFGGTTGRAGGKKILDFIPDPKTPNQIMSELRSAPKKKSWVPKGMQEVPDMPLARALRKETGSKIPKYLRAGDVEAIPDSPWTRLKYPYEFFGSLYQHPSGEY